MGDHLQRALLFERFKWIRRFQNIRRRDERRRHNREIKLENELGKWI